MPIKHVKIIGDGLSDYLVIKRLVSVIVGRYHPNEALIKFLEFDNTINLINQMDKFIDEFKKSKKSHQSNQIEHDPFYREFASFKNGILTILTKVVGTLEKEIYLSNRDIVIINTDSEISLFKKLNYFQDHEPWAYSLNAFLELVIEEFYDRKVSMGYDYQSLPMILPLLLFPSIEILVAACIECEGNFDQEYRSLKAKPDLKQKVWETDSIHEAFETGMFDEILKEYIVPENLNKIYKHIPEARKLIQILGFSSCFPRYNTPA